MANVSNNFNQCSFCSNVCNEENQQGLVPSLHQEQKLKIILHKLSSSTTQWGCYPTCDKCRQEFITNHNIPESCFQILPSVEPNVIKMEPELMIDDHELSNSNSIFDTDPSEQEAEMPITGRNGEVFFISEIDEEGNNISQIPVARTHTQGKKTKTLECEKCEKKFHSKHGLTLHLRTHTGQRRYSCPHCPKAFKNSYYLQNHIRVHTGERPFPCLQCPKAFKNSSALKNHNRLHTGERPYSCSNCPKTFRTRTALQRHIRIHTDERPYSCPHCPKAFRNFGEHQRHVRTHTDERPYSCPQCPKAFAQPSTLKQHIRVHTDERPHSCPHCPKAFKDGTTLKWHIRTHTGERPFPCPHCHKAFTISTVLTKHLKAHCTGTSDSRQESLVTVKEEMTEC
ncbi:oocyte zinc finger protein XlCOF6.1-like isoform X2 [Toxorhynchites rutilus septentrionalis]|uniref:oocyte zinc finger protein XlCOF6.1-like isoform X2 n=1 Tax=Toxorhynchites rutilus septentrionalis TaxID=329112 RepID=UPI00247B0481|nr:oocyte zinc finger protein XlCOF6.1-like isoform X2 [Toxorhynchites rutilus septentrionalis]